MFVVDIIMLQTSVRGQVCRVHHLQKLEDVWHYFIMARIVSCVLVFASVGNN